MEGLDKFKGTYPFGLGCLISRLRVFNFEVFDMNDFGLVQLIWIKRLVSETSRINTLIECKKLSANDLNRYKSVISAIDDFCAFVINSQDWMDINNISKTVEEVEMVLFQHFYEQIDAFENEEVHLDLSGDDEVNLMFENPFIENQRFDVIDDESYMNLNVLKGLEESLSEPVLEGEIIDLPEEIEFEISNEDPLLDLFDMKPGESREISVADFISILTQNQDGLSFTLNPEMFPDEMDGLSEDKEVSLEEFIAHLIDQSSPKPSDFDFIDEC